VGAVNTYLIEGEPLTLVDSGPNSALALEALIGFVEGAGHKVEDIDLLVVTHHHVDHMGLASVLARRSGAKVAALADVAPYLANWTSWCARDDEFREVLMARHGVAENVLVSVRPGARLLQGWGAPVDVDVPLSPGSSLRCGNLRFEVAHRPGHSPADILLVGGEAGVILGGDHLLQHISSNALISHPLTDVEGSHDRPRPLVAYRESLAQTRACPAQIVLAGHGPPVSDHVSLIDLRLREQDERAEKLLEIVRVRPHQAHELAVELWGEVALTQLLLTMSEVLGHLDLLCELGEVVERVEDRFSWFEFAS
jgi:glyoxylase-like metal-dependent hydrolase (beta-lactamase superfamily II)